MSGAPDTLALIDFVYDEARLLDDKRFDDWYELFTDDGLYWMPLTRGQPDGLDYQSLFHEDKLLLKVRIERLKNPRSFSQQVPSYSHHVLQMPRIERATDTETVLRTPFVYIETQGDAQIVLGATAYHHLVRVDGRLRMRMKKVELVNPDAGFPSIQMFP